jgi:L-threonylcarbamoyladenylate synthase
MTPDESRRVDEAVTVLRAGGLVGMPTETVYGLAADASNEAAVRRIFAVKGRPADHPLIVHVADAAALAQWATDVPAAAALRIPSPPNCCGASGVVWRHPRPTASGG